MKDTLTRVLGGYRTTFSAFTTGQKLVAVLGTLALLLGGFMVFRWASTPSMAPLFSNLSSEDASAVIEELDAQGVPYEISGGGDTVMVPRDAVHSTRITLSGEGLPSSSDGGYSILDDQGLATSEFKEQTDFKRAMEGELSATIEALDGVSSAVVHLALPEKQVFADEQDPATASVLVATSPGSQLDPQQVQAVVHLVASSIDGLDPSEVTVADSAGQVLTGSDGSGSADGSTRVQQVAAAQDEIKDRLQTMLDRVVGPGNSTTQVTVDMDFDKATTQTTEYVENPDLPALSESSTTETYSGPAASGASGVVGPDGQMDPTGTGAESGYEKTESTSDNAIGSTVEHREKAPGSITATHIGVVLDARATGTIAPGDVRELVASAVGIDQRAGDTISVTSMPFDRTLEDAAAEELAAAADADADADQVALYRQVGLAVLVALMVLLAFVKGRRRAKAREQATTYVVEQLRADQARAAALAPAASPATLALEQSELAGPGGPSGAHTRTDDLRGELTALVERQPEEVAALLRGWLVEKG